MNKILVCFFTLLFTGTLSAQINPSDSTVQVIGYWDLNETQSFEISYEKYKIENEDTSAYELIKYEVDITIKDSTANSYVIEWFYKNFEIQTDNPLVQKLAKLAEDMPVLIKTDELGAFQEVVNWEEVRDYIQKVTKTLKKELVNVPNIDQIIDQVIGIYSSKAAIEGNAIKDALQLYTFHGGKYKLGSELNGQVQMQNNYGGPPFDTDLTVWLDEIDEENGASIIRMYQAIDSVQLTDATYGYLKQLGTFGDQLPKREDFPVVSTEIWTVSRIHGDTGWITYSVETKEVKVEGITNIEERIMQIK